VVEDLTGDDRQHVAATRDAAVDRVLRAHALNQPAADEARSVDQRATAIAAVASLAASLSLAGAALILDADKLTKPAFVRLGFGLVLSASVLFFLAAAVASVWVHRQRCPLQGLIWAPDGPASVTDDGLFAVATRLEDGITGHWKTVTAKHRGAVVALLFLVAGLVCILLLTVLAVVAAPS
jgi:hypothetical protein